MSNCEFNCHKCLLRLSYVIYFYRCACGKNPMKGRKNMHHNMLTDNKKSFIVKVIFFLALLSCVALIYFESGLVKDAVYFMLVLAFFIKYFIIKLYH